MNGWVSFSRITKGDIDLISHQRSANDEEHIPLQDEDSHLDSDNVGAVDALSLWIAIHDSESEADLSSSAEDVDCRERSPKPRLSSATRFGSASMTNLSDGNPVLVVTFLTTQRRSPSPARPRGALDLDSSPGICQPGTSYERRRKRDD